MSSEPDTVVAVAAVNTGKFWRSLAPVSASSASFAVTPPGPRSMPSELFEWIRFRRIDVPVPPSMSIPVPLKAMMFGSVGASPADDGSTGVEALEHDPLATVPEVRDAVASDADPVVADRGGSVLDTDAPRRVPGDDVPVDGRRHPRVAVHEDARARVGSSGGPVRGEADVVALDDRGAAAQVEADDVSGDDTSVLQRDTAHEVTSGDEDADAVAEPRRSRWVRPDDARPDRVRAGARGIDAVVGEARDHQAGNRSADAQVEPVLRRCGAGEQRSVETYERWACVPATTLTEPVDRHGFGDHREHRRRLDEDRASTRPHAERDRVGARVRVRVEDRLPQRSSARVRGRRDDVRRERRRLRARDPSTSEARSATRSPRAPGSPPAAVVPQPTWRGP